MTDRIAKGSSSMATSRLGTYPVPLKAGYVTGYYLISFGLLASLSKTTYAGPVSLSLKPATGRIELAWPAAMTNSSSQRVFPEYEIEYSTDLNHWTPVGGKVRGIEGRSGPRLSLSLDEPPAPSFFRVIANPDSTTTNQVGEGGAQVFGYDEQFQKELDQLGFLRWRTSPPTPPPRNMFLN